MNCHYLTPHQHKYNESEGKVNCGDNVEWILDARHRCHCLTGFHNSIDDPWLTPDFCNHPTCLHCDKPCRCKPGQRLQPPSLLQIFFPFKAEKKVQDPGACHQQSHENHELKCKMHDR